MTIFKGVMREGEVASNIADFNKFGVVNPKWNGIWGIHIDDGTKNGMDCVLLTPGSLSQGLIDDVGFALRLVLAGRSGSGKEESVVEDPIG